MCCVYVWRLCTSTAGGRCNPDHVARTVLYVLRALFGQCVYWLREAVAHAGCHEQMLDVLQVLPTDVDYRVMLTFLEFYQSMLQFVLFRLYHGIQVSLQPLSATQLPLPCLHRNSPISHPLLLQTPLTDHAHEVMHSGSCQSATGCTWHRSSTRRW